MKKKAMAVLASSRAHFYTTGIKPNTQLNHTLSTDLTAGLFVPSIDPKRTVRFNGPVTRTQCDQALRQIERLQDREATTDIVLMVTSSGGPTGVAMNFFDTVRHVLRPPLVTIGSGDVDSSGVIIFLAAERRYVTKRTTLLLHPAGRFFSNQRYTTIEMASMLAEDQLKDMQYAGVIAERSNGRLTVHEVLALMQAHTVLTPEQCVEYGLAGSILP